MALFLSESVKVHNTQTFQEVLIEGIELTQEYNTINEAILRADFILHNRKETLNESTYALQEANFITKAYDTIKGWAGKAWDWVKKYWAKIKAKAIEIYNRIKERVTGKGLEGIPKSVISKMEIRIKALEVGQSFISKVSKANDPMAVASAMQSTAKTLQGYEEAITNASKETGTMTVSPTYFNKLTSTVEGIEKAIEAAAKEAEGKLAETEKANKEAADKVNKVAPGSIDPSEKSRHIEVLKAIVAATKDMVVKLSKFVASEAAPKASPDAAK
jgi:hypothetical protein